MSTFSTDILFSTDRLVAEYNFLSRVMAMLSDVPELYLNSSATIDVGKLSAPGIVGWFSISSKGVVFHTVTGGEEVVLKESPENLWPTATADAIRDFVMGSIRCAQQENQ